MKKLLSLTNRLCVSILQIVKTNNCCRIDGVLYRKLVFRWIIRPIITNFRKGINSTSISIYKYVY